MSSKHQNKQCPYGLRLRLKEEMASRKMTVQELAEKSGCSRATISRMCNNPFQTQYDSRTIAAIAWALQLQYPGILFEFFNQK